MRSFETLVYAALAIGCLILMTGCETPRQPLQVQEVHIPVPVAREVPAVLLEPIEADKPVFVSPADPAASSALTPDGERALKDLLLAVQGRMEAWKAWATE
ncbi:MAG: hypothetical protein RLN89_08510 [Parvibaculum sp.]